MAYTGTDANKTASFSSLIAAKGYIAEIYYNNLKMASTTYDKVMAIKRATSVVMQENAIGELEAWSATPKTEGAEFSYSNFTQSTAKSFTMLEYANSFDVTQIMIEDNQWPNIMARAGELADGATARQEALCAGVYDDAVAAGTYTTLAGDALGDATHNLINSSSTVSNLGTTALSAAGLQELEILGKRMVNEGGIYVDVKYDTLLVAPEKEREAMELVGSDKDPLTPNNAINTYKGKYKVVAWPYLSSTSMYFLIASGNEKKMKPILYTYVEPQLKMVPEPLTGNTLFQGRFRSAVGIAQYQHVLVSTGAA